MLTILFWLVVLFIGSIVAAPMVVRLLDQLPTRGYGFSKTVFLVVFTYIYWMAGNLGFVTNTTGGLWLSFLSVAAISTVVVVSGSGWRSVWTYAKGHWRYILRSELIFLLGFLVFAYYRSFGPAISGTEKPMELAFINSIMSSTGMPPNDPWLSGYAISYYYMGYLTSAMLALMTGASASLAFNLTLAMTFGLVCQTSYELIYNLLQLRQQADIADQTTSRRVNGVLALLGPFFILIVSNAEGFLESLHARGLFWNKVNGTYTSDFWSWLSILELNEPPPEPLGWMPHRAGWLFWRASRVLSDYTQTGGRREVIDEFPFFSYLLGDLHPHVVSMPVILCALGLLLHLYLYLSDARIPSLGVYQWFRGKLTGNNPYGRPTRLHNPAVWLTALVLGSLYFMNSWDFPLYLVVAALILTGARLLNNRLSWQMAATWVEWLIFFGIAGMVLYFPFHLTFASQAGGFLPSLGFFTRGSHLWVMFGTLFVFIIIIGVTRIVGSKHRDTHRLAFLYSSALVFGLWLMSYLAGVAIAAVGSLAPPESTLQHLVGLLTQQHEASSMSALLTGSLVDRLQAPGAWLTVWMLLYLINGGLLALRGRELVADASSRTSMADRFMLILIFAGLGLILVPEFFYLRDFFGTRMNTIFKFYYQVWLLLALASAYTLALIIKSNRTPALKYGALTISFLAVIISLFYPLQNLTTTLLNDRVGLDGALIMERYNPEDYQATQWLKQQGGSRVVTEAIGGSYSEYARVATWSGVPTVLGWPGHESQWRGGSREIGSRQTDIKMLYESESWEEILPILRTYTIDYIYIGQLEMTTYEVNEAKFVNHLPLVYNSQSVRIYQVTEESLR